jgi:hypothetical protein
VRAGSAAKPLILNSSSSIEGITSRIEVDANLSVCAVDERRIGNDSRLGGCSGYLKLDIQFRGLIQPENDGRLRVSSESKLFNGELIRPNREQRKPEAAFLSALNLRNAVRVDVAQTHLCGGHHRTGRVPYCTQHLARCRLPHNVPGKAT